MPHPASICSAALFYQSLQWNIDANELPFQTRDCHDMHATTLQTTEGPKEDVRSTPVHQRAIASTHRADREPARTRNPTSRLQQKNGHAWPSAGARFFAEKARTGKCVFLSVGLLSFGQFSGPGKPGPFRAPGRTAAGRGRGEAETAGRLKKGTRQCGRRPARLPVRFFLQSL